MVLRLRFPAILLALALGVASAACGDDDDAATQTTETSATTSTTTAAAEASVNFVEPTDGASVTSPVSVTMAATNFTIEPAGDGTVREGAGHFHIMIDTECVTPGEVIPSDDSHQHYGDGATEAELELAPGSHTLCLQAGNGAHTALDLTETITIEVTG